ncbi:MAG: EAL domain-containing protein [Pseudomonadota bacterium]|jgi:diguanylate cyclase (GGDEF)-like protein/PAS domain S-box-containing protein|nr:EAL domain-containing protein [Pseudomonadota bacterium]
MSIFWALCLLLALLAAVVLVLRSERLRHRERRTLESLARQIERLPPEHPTLSVPEAPQPAAAVGELVEALNRLLGAAALHPGRAAEHGEFRALAERLPQAVLVQRETIVYANPALARLLGVTPRELIGRTLAELVTPEYAELVAENARRRLAGQAGAECHEVDLAGADGVVRIELRVATLDYDGPALLMTGTEVLPEQGAAPAHAADGMPDGGQLAALDLLTEAVVATDRAGDIMYLNAAAARLMSVPQDQALGHTLGEVVSLIEEGDRRLISEPIRQAIGSGIAVNLGRRALLVARNDGSERSIELSASPIRAPGGRLSGALVLLHDVSELRGIARQMSYQATHDALTGLVNRPEFERRLQEAAESGHRGDGQHVLCCLDLDRFKVVNDTSGHVAGDGVLREVAKVLRDAVRDSDTVARLGGDEFGMLLIGCPLEKARQIADDVCRAVADHRFVWRDKIFNLGVSVGLVEISRESGAPEELLVAADSACYVAKKRGSGRVAVYSAHDEALARHSGEIQWLQRLQASLRENSFQLYQQPIVPAYGDDSGGPAMEVFVRLNQDEGESLSSSEFVRAAERYRLMGMVDRWVVQTTLAALGRGALQIPPRRCVAINVSGQTLGDPDFLEFVVECLDGTGVTPSQVCFELSESSVVANLEHARRFVGVLHGMGCRFALDDFGSGVGSFSNLRTLPMDYLKIDGSFMRNLARDSVNQAMVTAMIELARKLNFKVIAEQVEDSAALEVARRMGIDYMQGYAIARPKPLPLAA